MRNIIILIALVFVSSAYGASCFEVSVSVDETKSDGSRWEWRGGKPDLKVCIYDTWGKRCKVKGNNYTNAFCQDSLYCDLGVIRFTESKAIFEVTNVNRYILPDSAIEYGECEIGKECKLGNATFNFKSVACE